MNEKVKYAAMKNAKSSTNKRFAVTSIIIFHFLFCVCLFLVIPVACQDPFNVTSEQFTASSVKGNFIAANAILNQQGAWVPAKNDQHQWLQVDLHRQVLVSGVVIQGRPDVKEWVTRYRVKYALDGVLWKLVKDESTSTEVYDLSLRLRSLFNKTD